MAAGDYFLKVDGIEGESQDSKHKNEIDIESYTWSQTNSGDAAARGGVSAGKVSMSEFLVTMKVNKATPKLFLACANGEGIKTAELTVRKAGKDQQEYLKIKLSDLIVSSFHTNADGSANLIPTDTVGFNFSKIEYEYKEQKADNTLGGSVKAGYDLKQNKKV